MEETQEKRTGPRSNVFCGDNSDNHSGSLSPAQVPWSCLPSGRLLICSIVVGGMALTDAALELADPSPDVGSLFVEFNDRFFGGKLGGVEVRWSKRMTLCAGVCAFDRAAGYCSIRLSEPLLKLRPRADLVNTLCHEMIHAVLFLDEGCRDRDAHGPAFMAYARRLNQEAGTQVTVFHSFHDEVDEYRTHVWQCDGPCQRSPPYFGLVRRSMNRAPGPSDWWWAAHAGSCGGVYHKIAEPDKSKTKKVAGQKRNRVTGGEQSKGGSCKQGASVFDQLARAAVGALARSDQGATAPHAAPLAAAAACAPPIPPPVMAVRGEEPRSQLAVPDAPRGAASNTTLRGGVSDRSREPAAAAARAVVVDLCSYSGSEGSSDDDVAEVVDLRSSCDSEEG